MPPLWRDVLLFAVTGVFYIVSLPFSWWQTFRIEERFGFNRMTLGLWLTDTPRALPWPSSSACRCWCSCCG